MQRKCATMVIETRIEKWVKIRFIHYMYKFCCKESFSDRKLENKNSDEDA